MTTPRSDEQPIVMHAPLTGDAERVAAHPRTLPEIVPPVVAHSDVIGTLVPTTGLARASAVPAAEAPTAVSAAPAERVFGLDVLRGVLLLAMNFTFTMPAWGPFPRWMYHTQVPPSANGAYVAVAGLTWQDLLFPMFVFTMAAAIPVAMSARLAKGKPYPDIVVQSLRRAGWLLLFAWIIGHVNPYWTKDYTSRGNVLALAGFAVAFALFVQPRPDWKPGLARAIRWAGWAGAAVLLFGVSHLWADGFSSERRDQIMSSLAFATVAGTLIWLFTRRSVRTRLIVLGLVVAGRMLAQQVAAVGDLWFANAAPWFYQPWYLDLLLLVIPGTIAGEAVWRWMRREPEQGREWPRARLAMLAVAAFSVAPILLVGLYERRYPLATTVAVAGVSGLMLWLSRDPASVRDRVLRSLFAWSALWLVLGMLAEPLEGGIKKDPMTLGFLLLTAGSATVMLGGLMIVADATRSGRRAFRPVALMGQNALLAYVVFMLGFNHVLWLTGIGERFTDTWPLATLRSVVLTSLVGLVVWYATRKRLVWKA